MAETPSVERRAEAAYSGVGTQRRVREATQALVAGAVIGTTLALYILDRDVAAELVAFSGGIIGWYFRDVKVGNGQTPH